METRAVEGPTRETVYARDLVDPGTDGPSLEATLDLLMTAVLRAAKGRAVDRVRFRCEPGRDFDTWTLAADLVEPRC